jgi:fibronectin type 3 domain-containing protein
MTVKEITPTKLVFQYEDSEAPPIVSNLQADAQEGKILLGWNQNSAADLMSYQIYRKDGQNEGWNLLSTSNSNQFTDSTARELVNYYYRLAAVHSSKNVGELSIHASALLPDRTPPDQVQDLSASFDGENVQLQWIAPNGQEDLKYVISGKRVNDGTEAYSRLHQDFLEDTRFTDNFFDYLEGDFYLFRVTAVDQAMNYGETVAIEIQIPDQTPPSAPANVQLSNDSGNKVYMSWQNAADWDVGEVNIYKGRDTLAYNLLVKQSVKRNSYIDYDVDPATSYYYAFTSIDTVGNESDISEWYQVFTKDDTAPVAVRSLRLERLDSEAILHWLPGGDQDLQGYNVYQANEPNGRYLKLNEELIADNQYELRESGWYHVKAVDTSGNESVRSELAHFENLKN